MARVTPKERERREAAAELAAMTDEKPSKRRTVSLEKAREEAAAMMREGDWTGAKARHLVGLYANMHEHVYGVEPEELRTKKTMAAALSSAKRMIEKEFKGEIARAVSFIRWTWKRERDREKRRRVDGVNGRRIDWRLQFALRHLLTDYRVEALRAKKAKDGRKR